MFKSFIFLVKTFKFLDNFTSGLSIKLVKWTGKSSEYIHPKHLIKSKDHHWYLEYIQEDNKVLDVGCGNGMHTMKIAKKAKEVVGIDLREEQLAIAGRQAEREGIRNARFMRIDLERMLLPFEDHFFDRVIFLDVIEHIYNRGGVLKEIGRILKEDGLLLFSAPNMDTSWKKLQRSLGISFYAEPDHKIEYTHKSLIKELETAGFKPCQKLEPIVLDTPLAGWIDLVGGIRLSWYQRLACWKRDYVKRKPEETTGWRVVCQVDLGPSDRFKGDSDFN